MAAIPASSPPVPAEAPSKRDAILDAALELFCEHTFDGTAVPLVAERANVGAGTIYRYFDSKEALVNAVYRRWKREMQRVLIDEAPRDATPREGFAHWWRGLWRFATEHPLAFAFLEMHHHAPYLDAESRALGSEIGAGAIAFVSRAQATGALRGLPPDVLIALVFGAFTGLMKSAADGASTIDERTIDQTEQCVWEMISVPKT